MFCHSKVDNVLIWTWEEQIFRQHAELADKNMAAKKTKEESVRLFYGQFAARLFEKFSPLPVN